LIDAMPAGDEDQPMNQPTLGAEFARALAATDESRVWMRVLCSGFRPVT
jgi:hypothetical protein